MPNEVLPLAMPAAEESLGATRLPLIAYARDRETLAILTEVLAPVLGPAAEFRLGDITQACAGLQRLTTPVAAVIVDICGETDPLAALDNFALYVEPGVRVFVIGDVENMGFYRQVVRGLGVQEYLYKPVNRDLVARILLPAVNANRLAPARGGRLVTVTGVRGGVGATTVAVNLAAQLADRSRHHVLLFDADPHGGSAALMLAVSPAGGLRAALEYPERVDALFIERASLAISDRLFLLAAEEPLDSVLSATEGAVAHLTSILCNRFNFVVTDLPRHVTPLNHELRELAHARVLVMDATLPSLRDALRHLHLPGGPRQAARPITVLNCVGAPGALTRSEVVSGLGGDVDVVIPWIPKQMKAAMILGQPGVKQRGPFQTAICGLANEILPQRTEPPKSWLGLQRRLRL